MTMRFDLVGTRRTGQASVPRFMTPADVVPSVLPAFFACSRRHRRRRQVQTGPQQCRCLCPRTGGSLAWALLEDSMASIPRARWSIMVAAVETPFKNMPPM